MADYNVNLSKFHWRVWQDKLGLKGTIDEYGHVEFGRQGPGVLTIFIDGKTPAKVMVNYMFIEDYFDIDLTTEKTLEICNSVNVFGNSAATLVTQGASIEAILRLLLPVQAADALPDEGFLRAAIGPVMSEIMGATKEFTAELRRKTH